MTRSQYLSFMLEEFDLDEKAFKDMTPEEQEAFKKRKAMLASPEYKAKQAAYWAGKKKEQEDTPAELLKVYMGKGNKKLDKHIKTFNLPAIKSCPNSSQCAKDCYAKQAELQYPDVKLSRERNLRMAKEDLSGLKKKIQEHLRPGDIVRIHESGDMFSPEYLNMWEEIVAANPDIMFYTYTKTEGMKGYDWGKIKGHSNFNLVSSIINGEKNFGPLEHIKLKAAEVGGHVCPCGGPDDKGKKCGTECKMCMTHGMNKIFFQQHGKGTKKEKPETKKESLANSLINMFRGLI